MSNTFVIKGGSTAAPTFASTLSEIKGPISSRGKLGPLHSARERAENEGFEAGFAKGREEGSELGYNSGYEAGKAEALEAFNLAKRAEFAQLAAELQAIQGDLQTKIEAWFAQSEKELEDFAVQIAEKLIDSQLSLDRSFVKQNVINALSQVTSSSNVRIRVNPFDSVVLSGCRDEILASCAGLTGVDIVQDSSIRGGCMIETERGVVDATIETRLELLKGGMEEAA